MKPFPHVVLFTTAAALYALPMSIAAAGTLLFAAGMSAVICADYSHRYRGLRVPRRSYVPVPATQARATFRAPPLAAEPHRLAA